MNNLNPWYNLSHDIYEKHMGHENVGQLDMLSRIVGEQLALISEYEKPTVAILGITGGNGLVNIKSGRYKSVIGIDINEEYLQICRERYGCLSELVLYKIDLMCEKERSVEILTTADLIIANLLVKHIHLHNFIDIVMRLTKPLISITIQYNPDGQIVSHSGYEAALEKIVLHGEVSNESDLTNAMTGAKYILVGRKEYILPNKKVFIRLDYRRGEELR